MRTLSHGSIRYARVPFKAIVRFFIIASAIYTFMLLNDVYSYKVFPKGALKAAEMSLLCHSGFWLTTLDLKGFWRFPVIVLLIPSAIGLYLFTWHSNGFTLVTGLVGLAWLIHKVFRGW